MTLNRQMRRLQARKAAPVVPIIEALVSKLKTDLDIIEKSLQNANESLREAQRENDYLRAEIQKQRHVFLNLFSMGMDLPLEQVKSLESALLQEMQDANKINDPENRLSTTESPDAQRGLETTIEKGDSESGNNQGPKT